MGCYKSSSSCINRRFYQHRKVVYLCMVEIFIRHVQPASSMLGLNGFADLSLLSPLVMNVRLSSSPC